MPPSHPPRNPALARTLILDERFDLSLSRQPASNRGE